MFMVHHVIATTLYLCVRFTVEAQTFMQSTTAHIISQDNSDLYCRNATGAEVVVPTCPSADWVLSYSGYPLGVVQFFPLAVVLGLLFVTHYLDLWNTYRQYRNIATRLMNRTDFTFGFQQFKRFIHRLRDRALLPSTIVQSILFAGCVVVAGITYLFPTNSFLTGSDTSEELEIVQSYLLVMALLMILLAGAGLMTIRERAVVTKRLGPFDILLLISFLGVLCDKIANILVFNLGLHSQMSSRSIIGIAEESLWMFQSVIQLVLIISALRREGRHAHPCCGTTPLSHALDTLIVLNFGTFPTKYSSYIVTTFSL
jgi:hypothetical protein